MIQVQIPDVGSKDDALFVLDATAPTYWSELYFYILVQALKTARANDGCILMESGNPLTDAGDLISSLGGSQAAIFTALDNIFDMGGE